MTTTRESEFEQAYRLRYVSEYGCGSVLGLGLGLGAGLGHGSGYGFEFGFGLGHGLGFGVGSRNSKKDLIDDNDS